MRSKSFEEIFIFVLVCSVLLVGCWYFFEGYSLLGYCSILCLFLFWFLIGLGEWTGCWERWFVGGWG